MDYIPALVAAAGIVVGWPAHLLWAWLKQKHGMP